MHDDLRRRALESGKTLSRKARSRQVSAASSRANSAANSRAASRNPSRQGSDDEEGHLSDETSYSVNSIDELMASPDDTDSPSEVWKNLLSEQISAMTDRKRSSVQGREERIGTYMHILTVQYAKDEIHKSLNDIISALLKSVKAESSEKETILALKALAATIVTDPDEEIYEAIHQQLKRTISDSESMPIKAAAIRALGTATFFGCASDDEISDVMEFLLEIIESDGGAVSADDDAQVVTAALEEWAFLATLIEDITSTNEPAMDAFVEQLESADPGVAIAAGENIALLYEKSYTEREDDDDVSSEDGESDPEENAPRNATKMVKRYNVYAREDQLKHILESLAKISGRQISKKDRKTLHSSFADILQSVEYPTRGPQYRQAINAETGKRFGSRLTVRIRETGEMRIDRWWKLHRLKALRRVLQGGFIVHYEKNEVVFESLPIMIARAARK